MQIRNAPAAADGGDLLACRMAMFGLDRDTLVNTDKYAFAEILRRCVNCTFREACTIDLKRDPNNPVGGNLTARMPAHSSASLRPVG